MGLRGEVAFSLGVLILGNGWEGGGGIADGEGSFDIGVEWIQMELESSDRAVWRDGPAGVDVVHVAMCAGRIGKPDVVEVTAGLTMKGILSGCSTILPTFR